MSQEVRIARAALREIGLAPIAEHIHTRMTKKTNSPYPSFTGSPINFETIPHWTKKHVRQAFLLAHQHHDPTAYMDKHGGIHCETCHPTDD